ncbi:FAD-dependent oxidoreductase [Micromonospora sp. DT81.3]|uniref:FAD-dependent oxidoreductase n=1 Tax=Micromonospora sp. DT81.3 TaxID=3416523 RepID=UPI003CED785D
MRVVVCGAGIGGLTLAQALRTSCDVTVVERDDEAVSTGGYRLAINGAATAVLARSLGGDLMAEVRAVSDGADRFAQFTVATDRLRPLLIAPEDPDEDRLLAQRRALRLLLTRGLEDRILWSTRVTRVEQSDGSAVVHLDSGEELAADLVVGAEGAKSPTVRAVTIRAPDSDLHLTGIAGSTPRTPGAVVPRFLRRGPALAFSADGTGMFLSLTSSGSGPLSPEIAEAVGSPSLVWGLIAPSSRVGPAPGRTPDDLVATALRLTRHWHPWMAERIEAADRGRVAAFSFRAADPARDFTPWRPRNITALGDAIHAMPPTGGQAAATAIRDAGELADNVLAHTRGELTLDEALRRYHRSLRAWAVPALRESLGPVRVIRALGNPGVALLARPLLRIA